MRSHTRMHVIDFQRDELQYINLCKSNASNRSTVSSQLSTSRRAGLCRLSTSTRGGLLQLPAGAGPPGALRAFAEGAVGK